MASSNGALAWNDTIENEGQEFVLLPEGDYGFTVVDFERGSFPGSAKLPACNKAVLQLEICTESGVNRVKLDLILHRNLEWKLSQFFRSIGLKRHGEPLVMDWSRVPGATGRCHVIQRKYTGRDGQERTVNDIDRFLDPEAPAAVPMQGLQPAAPVLAYEDIPF